MFDGKQWRELASMSVQRVNHACSLVDMDDGEVCLMNILKNRRPNCPTFYIYAVNS
jgi:hypothetical protein